MAQIFNEMVLFFEEDEWPFEQIAELPAIRTGFAGDNGKWTCYAQAREDMEQFIFYSILPVNVPPNRLGAMAEFIARANYGMIIGNFELSYDDGEVRYKTSIDVEGDDLSFPLIKQMVYANVATMDHYLPGLMTVIYTDVTPAQAIERIEADRRKEIPPDDRDLDEDNLDDDIDYLLDDDDFLDDNDDSDDDDNEDDDEG
jgi:hypothetical protein